VTTWTYKNF